MDPTPLNKFIIREGLEVSPLESIFTKIRKAKWFTVLDAFCEIYQVSLDETSSEICTFITPFGRYKFNRLPYGISCAPEIFQKYIKNMIERNFGIYR